MFDFSFTKRSALHRFFTEHSEALQNAAYLLGGRPWLRRTQRLIDDLSASSIVNKKSRREAQELLGLLLLEHVHDPDRPEAEYFADLDPAMPHVEEICLLADGLAQVIQPFQDKPTADLAAGEGGWQ